MDDIARNIFGFIGIIVLFISLLPSVASNLNVPETRAFWNNVQALPINFFAQLGNVGTILSVMLLLLVIGGSAYGGYQRYQKARDDGTSGL